MPETRVFKRLADKQLSYLFSLKPREFLYLLLALILAFPLFTVFVPVIAAIGAAVLVTLMLGWAKISIHRRTAGQLTGDWIRYRRQKKEYIWLLGKSKGKYGKIQDLVDVLDIRSNSVRRRKIRSWVRVIALTELDNWAQAGEERRRQIMSAYEEMLNALGFQIWIIDRTRMISLSGYRTRLEELITEKPRERMSVFRRDHLAYTNQTVNEREMLNTEVFVVFFAYEPLVLKGMLGWIAIKLLKRRFESDNPDLASFIQLDERQKQLLKAITKLGLNGRVVTTRELPRLLHSFWTNESWVLGPKERGFSSLLPFAYRPTGRPVKKQQDRRSLAKVS